MTYHGIIHKDIMWPNVRYKILFHFEDPLVVYIYLFYFNTYKFLEVIFVNIKQFLTVCSLFSLEHFLGDI